MKVHLPHAASRMHRMVAMGAADAPGFRIKYKTHAGKFVIAMNNFKHREWATEEAARKFAEERVSAGHWKSFEVIR